MRLRLTLHSPGTALQQQFKTAEIPQYSPRYNIATGQPLRVLRQDPDGVTQWESAMWGFLPHWASDPKNSRYRHDTDAESVLENPAYRTALRWGRCLIPADGFYLWSSREVGSQPYYVTRRDGRPFALAGLWEHWQGPGGHEGFALLTTHIRKPTAPFENRAPALIAPGDYLRWLTPTACAPHEALSLLKNTTEETIHCHPVSLRINSLDNDDPSLITPYL